MNKATTAIAVIAVLALAGPAAAAKTINYKGKTKSGHVITFKVKGKRIHDLVTGIRTSCIPIQGGGRALGGSDIFGWTGSRRIKRHDKYTFMAKPAFHWREVTTNYDLWLKRGKGRITGRMRIQYQFLVSKFPIGTFAIYSCLGGDTFKATARR